MTDPLTAAAASAGKALTTAVARRALTPTASRPGSPHERRDVYWRFSEAATRWLVLVQRLGALRRQPFWVFTPIQWARLPLEVSNLHGDLLIAYQELHLVASPVVLAAADEVLSLAGELLGPANDKKRTAEFEEQSLETAARLRRFTEVCRADLAYVPRPWQVWRPAWWGQKLASYQGRRVSRRALRSLNRELSG